MSVIEMDGNLKYKFNNYFGSDISINFGLMYSRIKNDNFENDKIFYYKFRIKSNDKIYRFSINSIDSKKTIIDEILYYYFGWSHNKNCCGYIQKITNLINEYPLINTEDELKTYINNTF